MQILKRLTSVCIFGDITPKIFIQYELTFWIALFLTMHLNKVFLDHFLTFKRCFF